MTPAYQIERICEAFDASCEQFESMLGKLSSEENMEMEHGQVETLIMRMGMELKRRLLQGHFDIRGAVEPKRDDVAGPDGRILTHCRTDCEEKLMSLFGQVTVRRKGYSLPGVSSQFPLNAALNLPPDKYSHGLRRRVAEEVANSSFDQTVESIQNTTGGKVPKRQTEEIAVSVAQDFDSFYSGRQTNGPEQASNILAMSVDQKGVVMRKEDLRPATRKAAEEANERCGSRLSPGEKPNRKRMATVAAVYSVESHKRTPEMIMGVKPQKTDRPRAENKRVWASVEKEPEEVIKAMLDEAIRRDPDRKRPWVVLLDGAEKQLDLVLSIIFGYRSDVTIILDFIHVLEYVWKAAYSFCAVGSKEAEEWVAERAFKILRGEAQSVAAQMRRSAIELGKEKQKAVEKCADYLEKY
ncbi:hypothetical protein DAMNIGENAA_33170 [Desulforhabdus amnigena]|uniref:ISKra4 family transposase n=1 Tax=Desulforhabdus amnigena TaxID=40218 RepID=A0A9W6FVW3_9BACT|nr:hypothetical protein DAMNIGENAA_33170 [Desulforhabdus amnigena]